jgi:hypothetical protein
LFFIKFPQSATELREGLLLDLHDTLAAEPEDVGDLLVCSKFIR